MVSASPLVVWRTPLRFAVRLPEPCNFNTKAVSVNLLMVSSWKLTRCKFTQNFDLFLVQIHTHICYSNFNDYHTLHHWHGCGHHHNWEFPVPMESCSLSSMRGVHYGARYSFCHLPSFFVTTSLLFCNLPVFLGPLFCATCLSLNPEKGVWRANPAAPVAGLWCRISHCGMIVM